MNIPEDIGAKLVIKGTFECRDKDGNLVKTIELNAEVPLKDIEEPDPGPYLQTR